MKLLVSIVLSSLLLVSCATSVPYTLQIKEDFSLNEESFKQVQFYTSKTIILERQDEKKTTATTGEDGDLVVNKTSSSERIVIPANRPCIFEGIEEDGTIQIRFELGQGRYLRFKQRTAGANERFYLVADWKDGRGELDYDNAVYYASSTSSSAYLLVKLKMWQKNKRKDRVVKGMKVK